MTGVGRRGRCEPGVTRGGGRGSGCLLGSGALKGTVIRCVGRRAGVVGGRQEG